MAVNAEQAEDWNGASGPEFIEQRERHERMLGPVKARLLAAARIQDGERARWFRPGTGCGQRSRSRGRGCLAADGTGLSWCAVTLLHFHSRVWRCRSSHASARARPSPAG